MGERVRIGRAFSVLCALVMVTATTRSSAVEVGPPSSLPVSPPVPRVVEPGTVPSPSAGRDTAAAQAGGGLVGVFSIEAGSCSGSGAAKGSSFRMIQPGGGANGPFLANSDSPCGDQTYTPLSPGTDGGLSTAVFQPNPARAFDGAGNATAGAITKPQRFMGVAFAVSTNPKDPQTGTAVAKPAINNDNGTLAGDVRAVSVAYNNQHFNQGSPKPDGSRPGLTGGPTGTYDRATGAFTLEWASTIVGGPFNGFTGKWHLEGTFRPSSQETTTTSAATPADASAAAVGTSAPGAVAAAPAPGTHPNTGPAFPPVLGLAALLFGSLGLVLSRRLVATSETVRGGRRAMPAGGRAHRP